MLHPTRGQIILEKIEKESELYVPTKAQGYEKGLVVASGSPHLQPGVTALFTTYGPISVRHEGREYTIAKEEDIISTL